MRAIGYLEVNFVVRSLVHGPLLKSRSTDYTTEKTFYIKYLLLNYSEL